MSSKKPGPARSMWRKVGDRRMLWMWPHTTRSISGGSGRGIAGRPRVRGGPPGQI